MMACGLRASVVRRISSISTAGFWRAISSRFIMPVACSALNEPMRAPRRDAAGMGREIADDLAAAFGA
jgi:hypothetical protein